MEDPKKIIEGIKHPEIDASLVELGMVKDIEVEDKKVKRISAFTLTVKQTSPKATNTGEDGFQQ